jgi:hypothetical protein
MIEVMPVQVRRSCCSDMRRDEAALTPSGSCTDIAGAFCNAMAMTDMSFSRE